jgi:hypothetical protein
MGTSARKESRWKKSVQAANDEIDKRQREIEAANMVRRPRLAVVPPPPSANRKQVRSWMRRNAEGHECATTLAEAANAALDLPAGAMDDETHWVWEEALSAIEWANA